MNRRILITGSTGLIGTQIVHKLYDQGDFIKIMSRDREKAKSLFPNKYEVQTFNWQNHNTPQKLSEIIEDTDIIINLAGANLGGKRWSKKYKKEIYDSRINITKLLVDSIELCNRKPQCLINASAVGIYGFCGDEIINEDSKPGNDFLAKLCQDWEMEAMKASKYNIRVVTIRAGIVLERNEGALKQFITPFKFFTGVYQGTGKQWLSWIHIDDIVNIYIFALQNDSVFGALNGTSPCPVTNKMFVGAIGKNFKKNLILPVPEFVLRIAVGEFAKNLVTGQRVYPKKAIEKGFNFRFPNLAEALDNLLKK